MKCRNRHMDGLGYMAGTVLFSRWSEFCRLRDVVLDQRKTDDIHDLRVASRRLRAALMLLAPYLPGKPTMKLSSDIRAITRSLGDVRNLDEALLYVQGLVDPPSGMVTRLTATREVEIGRVAGILKKFSCHDRGELLRKAVESLSAEPEGSDFDRTLEAYFSETSLRRYQQLRELLVSVGKPEQVAGRHRLRIAIKKWRYLLEILGQVCGQEYGQTLETLKEYQTVLGSLNDLVVFQELFREVSLTPRERKLVGERLEHDSAEQLEKFVQLVATRKLHYIFLL